MARGVAQTASEPDKLDIAIALFEQGFTEDRVEAALREKGTLEEAIQWLSGKTNDKMVHDNPRVEVSKTPSLCTGMFFAPCGEITTGTSTSSSSDPAACKKEDRSQEHALEETPIQDYADLVIPIEAKDARKWWRKAAARWPQIIADLQAQAATSIVRPPPVFTQAPAQETPKRKRPYPLEVPEEAGKQQAADNDDLTQPAKLARVDVCSPKTLPRVATPCASPHAMRLNRTCETCVICYNDAPQLRAVRLSCGHGWYCAQCVLRHAEARLSIGAADVSCPECNCALPERDLRKLLPPEFIDRLLARSLEQAVSSAADLWACPTPNCPMRVALEDGELPRLQCNVCGKSSCLRCGVQPYHKGSTCEEHAEKMRNRGQRCSNKCCGDNKSHGNLDMKQAKEEFLAACDVEAAKTEALRVIPFKTRSREATTTKEELQVSRATSISYFDSDLAELEICSREKKESHPNFKKGKFLFKSGALYAGQWQGWDRHGFGVQWWPDGAVYEGEWVHNKAEGQGRFAHSDGDTYVGQWEANVAQGRGVYCHKDITTYEGDWHNDFQEGYGVESWDGGARFEGHYKAGQKEGFGIYFWPDGSEYKGHWDANCINGFGAYVGNDGRWFKGKWQDSMIHGIGKYAWRDGRQYCGQFAFGKKDSFGIFIWPDGCKYQGFWRFGRQHGYGSLSHSTGEYKDAIWLDGKMVSSKSDAAKEN